jgi:PLP dependent protein
VGIAENLRAVQERIGRACARAGRDAASVALVAVSKLQPAEAVREALLAGQRAFGENYAQELREKALAMPLGSEVEWHFLGALQTNKAKLVVGRAALVHTCDRLSLAQELHKRAAAQGLVQRVLVEVNLAREPQKGGIAPDELPAFVDAVAGLAALRCEGLMCIPPADRDARPFFRALRELRIELARRSRQPLAELSMGMSADYEAAIEEGATIVRVGTAIFGERPKK